MMEANTLADAGEFMEQVNGLSGQMVQRCYHCHKCSSGCPVVDEMEYGPDRLLHLVQLGQKKRVLRSRDIWLCASCETCGAHCPNEIHVGRVIDGLRQMAYEERAPVAEPHALLFHRLFLRLVRLVGRMHEASLLGLYLMRTGELPRYLGLALRLLAKGKVPLIPRGAGARREIDEIFVRSEGDHG